MHLRAWDKMERLLRPLSAQEVRTLERSLQQQGQHHPITALPDGRIIDGLNRWRVLGGGAEYRIVDLSEIEALALGIALNEARRQMTPEQSAEMHRELAKLDKEEKRALAMELRAQGMTQKEAAAHVGVVWQTVDAWETVSNSKNGKANTPDYRVKLPGRKHGEVLERIKRGETQQQIAADMGVTRGRIAQIRKRADKKAQQEAEKAERTRAAGHILPELRIGDFRTILADIPDGSVDLILTDPPYGKEAITLYRDLGIFAARVLKPDGSLLAYTGQSVLGEVLSALSESLRYWWTLCMQHSGTGQKLPGKWVFVDWKPIVWFVKERRRGENYIKDLLHGEIPDKTTLAWAQGTGEVEYLLRELTGPGDLIVDPFAGTGRWGDLAGQLGRRWIGTDLQAGGGLNT